MPELKEIINIRSALPGDAAAITENYNYYVNRNFVTFEEKPVSPTEIQERILEVQSFSLPWLVAERQNDIVGYAFASPWKERTAYRFSAEVSVYVRPDRFRRGIGFQLYHQLLPALKSRGVHAAMGGIALPNDASVALHEKLGFKKVAHFKDVGYKFGQWIDVGYWQLLL
jgi:L-amino acid N-acyltransferase YncA